MPRPLRGKFPHITYDVRDVIYVAGLTHGLVKVGMTNAPRARLVNLAWEARRAFGAELIEFQQFEVASRAKARIAERAALESLAQVGSSRPEHHEYFSGIPFDHALQIVRGAVESVDSFGERRVAHAFHVARASHSTPLN